MLQMLECTAESIPAMLLAKYWIWVTSIIFVSDIIDSNLISDIKIFLFVNVYSSNKEPVLEEEGQYTETIPRLGQFTELIITSGGSSADQDFNCNIYEAGYVKQFKIFYWFF